ncbi:MAG TPA: hypothetical protein VLC53_01150, partial [Myxococcota bacterium]|nr:hypothetical protein [Myxococcota bacterium]
MILSSPAFRRLVTRRGFGALAAVLLLALAATPPATGESTGPEAAPESPTRSEAPESEPAPPPRPSDPYDRGSPRSTMRGFLEAARAGDWERAQHYLELRSLPAVEGPERAREFKIVLDRTLWVDLDALSDEPAGERDDGLAARRDLVGHVDAVEPPVPVFLDRVAREDGVPIWKVSAATLRALPILWTQFGDGPLARWLPEPFTTWSFLELQLWQWIGLLVLAAAAGL